MLLFNNRHTKKPPSCITYNFHLTILSALISYRDFFARPREGRPIQALELGFPDQPLTRRAGSGGKIAERASSPPIDNIRVYIYVCISMFSSPLSPLNRPLLSPQHFLLACLLVSFPPSSYSHLPHLVSPLLFFPPANNSANIFQLI